MSPKASGGRCREVCLPRGNRGRQRAEGYFCDRDTARNREHHDHAQSTAESSGGAAAGHAHRNGDQHNRGDPNGHSHLFRQWISLGTGALNPGGQATLTTSSLAAGQDSILAQYDGDSNFAPGNSAPLAVVVAGFAPPPTNLTVTPGQNLVIPLTLFAPAGSTMSFTLSCSGLPAKTTCMFDMNPVTPGPSGTTVQLTLTTMAGSKLPPVQPHKGPPALRGFGLAALLAALFAAATLPWRQALDGGSCLAHASRRSRWRSR